MPNPNPTRRTRRASAPELPRGMRRHGHGSISYRYTERGTRFEVYGATPEECYAKRYAPPPEPRTIDPTAVTLAAWLATWLEGHAARANTLEGHRLVIEKRLIPLFGETVTLAELEPANGGRSLILARFAELRTHRVRGGGIIAPRTVALAHSTLRTALYAAVDDGKLAGNPAARIKPNGTTGARARGARLGVELHIPTELEVRRLIAATRGDPWGALIPLAAFTGLRQSEALGLRPEDIELDVRWLTVANALRRTDRALDDPKNDSSARAVPFHAALAPVLSAQLDARDRAEFLAGGSWTGGERLVWCKPDGSPLVGSTVSKWFAKQCRAAGIPHYRYHDLRHFYATTLLSRGVEVGIVAKRLGHASTRETFRTYWHFIKGDDRLDTASIAGDALASALG